MTDNLKDALAPCPFCGGEAERAHQEAQRGLGKAVYIWCPNCESRTGLAWSGSAEAIAAWNRRAPITPPAADLVERVARAMIAPLGHDPAADWSRVYVGNGMEADGSLKALCYGLAAAAIRAKGQ
jgi:Lar family restriction alleviation protein